MNAFRFFSQCNENETIASTATLQKKKEKEENEKQTKKCAKTNVRPLYCILYRQMYRWIGIDIHSAVLDHRDVKRPMYKPTVMRKSLIASINQMVIDRIVEQVKQVYLNYFGFFLLPLFSPH